MGNGGTRSSDADPTVEHHVDLVGVEGVRIELRRVLDSEPLKHFGVVFAGRIGERLAEIGAVERAPSQVSVMQIRPPQVRPPQV